MVKVLGERDLLVFKFVFVFSIIFVRFSLIIEIDVFFYFVFRFGISFDNGIDDFVISDGRIRCFYMNYVDVVLCIWYSVSEI